MDPQLSPLARASDFPAMGTVQRATLALAPIRGRKSLLLFSAGFVDDPAAGSRDVEAAAREANTAVYFVDVRGLNSGRLDHIPADLVHKVAPALNDHLRRIAETPAVAAYYASFGSR